MDCDELALQAQLEREIRGLEQELHRLDAAGLGLSGRPPGAARGEASAGGALPPSASAPTIKEGNHGEGAACGPALGLDDLPVEHVCLFLPAVGLVALRRVGCVVGAKLVALLERIDQQWRETAASALGIPLLMPLLRFMHYTQAPCLVLRSTASGEACLRAHVATNDAPEAVRGGATSELGLGPGVSALPGGWAGPSGAQRWCPLWLEGTPTRSLHSHLRAFKRTYSCSCGLGGHVTPRCLRVQLGCEPDAEARHVPPAPSEISLSLVDTAVPEQPLFSVRFDCAEMLRRAGRVGAPASETRLHATVRVVVRCPGSAGAWAYQQKAWPLGAAFLGADPASGLGAWWLQLHVEFDWEAALCAAVVDRRVEGPLELHDPGTPQAPIFSGCEPTVDQLRIQTVPGVTLALAELLVA